MQFLDLGFVASGIRWLMAALCEFIYQLIGWMFNLFMNITKVNILSSEQVAPIYQRVTMILTIIMIFYVTFEFVKFVVQPDGITDKEKGAGKIVYKMILVVILISFVPTIFTWAYKFQSVVVDRGIIGKVIIGNANAEPKQFGTTFSANLLGMFYGVDESIADKDDETCGDLNCVMLVQMNLGMLAQNGKVPYLTIGLNETTKITTNMNGEKVEVPKINFAFHGFLPVIVGVFMVYILVLYCIDVGTRWAQLIYLQIIAPIPIIGYLAPNKDGPFQKWVKQCITTYLDLFIRISIIYFILLLCSILMDDKADLLANIDPDMQTFVYVILILGILLFAQKAPKLLGELFPKMVPASGNFGLSGKDRLPPIAARAAGAALGGTLGLARRGVVSAVNRHRRNKANGTAGFSKEAREKRKAQRDAMKANKKAQRESARDNRNAQTVSDRKKKLENQKAKTKAASDAYEKIKNDPNVSQAEKNAKRATAMAEGAKYAEMLRKSQGRGQNQTLAEHRKTSQTAYEDLQKAKADLELVRKHNPNDDKAIKAAEEKVANAQKNYSEKLQKTNDYMKSSEYQEWKKKDLNKDSALAETRNSFIHAIDASAQATKDVATAEQEHKNAQQELEALRNDPNATQEQLVDAAKKVDETQVEVDKAKSKESLAQSNVATQQARFKTVSNGDQETTNRILETANEQVAKDNNEKHVNVAGAAVVGGLAGAARGVWTGAHAKTGKEIFTKTAEAWKKDTKTLRANETFLDNGGAAGVRGYVDKTVATIQTGLGIDTSYENTIRKTKVIEENIKQLDSQISLAGAASKAADNAKDIIQNKILDTHTSVTAGTKIKTGLKDENGNDKTITIDKASTVANIVRDYESRAARTKDEADAATQNVSNCQQAYNEAVERAKIAKNEYDNLDKNASQEERNAAKIKQQELENDVKIKEASLKTAENNKAQLYIKAEEDAQIAKNVKKKLAEHTATEILKGNTEGAHAAAIQQITVDLQNVKSALADPVLTEKLRKQLLQDEPVQGEMLFNALVTNQITDFDTYDKICTAYNKVEATAKISKTNDAESLRQINTGHVTQAQKAAQDTANGGK